MGCVSSRDHCIAPPPPPPHTNLSSSPIPTPPPPPPPPPPPLPLGRSLTLTIPIVVHHLPLFPGDSHHLVSLTSTTYGSPLLLLDPLMDPTISKKPQLLSRSLTYHPTNPTKNNIIKPLWKHLADDHPKPKRTTNVILYTTSLRGIRRTHEDCCAVRNILRGFRIAVDERDVSMDAAYRKEVQSLMGKVRPLSLPQLFVGGRWVGGAEEVRQLHEAGELGKVLEGVSRQDPAFVCGGCGGVRFIPCGNCNGSRKVFDEEAEMMRRCEECNENGLVRCPNCCRSF